MYKSLLKYKEIYGVDKVIPIVKGAKRRSIIQVVWEGARAVFLAPSLHVAILTGISAFGDPSLCYIT